jgi:hypothetical protein
VPEVTPVTDLQRRVRLIEMRLSTVLFTLLSSEDERERRHAAAQIDSLETEFVDLMDALRDLSAGHSRS